MPKKQVIPDMILERMYSMYGQGFNFKTISIETGYSPLLVACRIREEGVKINKRIANPIKAGKYDHLFEEKICEGKMYNQYKKK